MSMKVVNNPFVALFLLLFVSANASASVIPDFWSLGTTVRQFDAQNNPNQDVQAIFTVQSPLMDSHTATLGSSVATTSYNINLIQSLGEYVLNVQHHCVNQSNSRTECYSQGRITLTTTTDVLVTASGSYAYQVPVDPMIASAGFTVEDMSHLPFPQTLFFDGGNRNTTLTGTGSGTIPFATSGILPAGRTYRLTYSFGTMFLTGAPNATADATGEIHFTTTALPEPTALALLTLGGTALLARRRR